MSQRHRSSTPHASTERPDSEGTPPTAVHPRRVPTAVGGLSARPRACHGTSVPGPSYFKITIVRYTENASASHAQPERPDPVRTR